MQQGVRLKLLFFQHLTQIFLTLVLLSFSAPVMALCVMMQNFESDDTTFLPYVVRGLYNTSRMKAESYNDLEIPVPTQISAAGELCYIFKTYDGLQYFINHRDKFPDEEIKRELGVDLPIVVPNEPLIINHISHGARCGIVDAGDILEFAKNAGKTHRIAMTNQACFSSDLLAKMLIDQENDPTQSYIDNFCLLTLSPFSRVALAMNFTNVKNYLNFDTTLAPFIKDMSSASPGMSFSQYLQKHNMFKDFLDDQLRPLGICSAANWGEMGLVEYLREGEIIFNFTKPYQEGFDPFIPSLMPQHERRIAAAANLINHVNDLLNDYFCRRAGDKEHFMEREIMVYASNLACTNLVDIRNAQAFSERYELMDRVGDISNKLNMTSVNQETVTNLMNKWKHQCQEDTGMDDKIFKVMRELIYYDTMRISDETFEPIYQDKLKEFVPLVATKGHECDEMLCDAIYAQYAQLAQNLREQEGEHYAYSRAKDHLKFDALQLWSTRKYAYILRERYVNGEPYHRPAQNFEYIYDEALYIYSEALSSNKTVEEFDCMQELEKVINNISTKMPIPSRGLAKKCTNIRTKLASGSIEDWPKLPTNYQTGDPYADTLAQILLGAIDINELTGVGLNGTPASFGDVVRSYLLESDYFGSTARELSLQFHNVTEVAMERTPNADYPLDVRRRAACDDFKLGGPFKADSKERQNLPASFRK